MIRIEEDGSKDDDTTLVSIMKGIIKNKEIKEPNRCIESKMNEEKEKDDVKRTMKRKLTGSSDSDAEGNVRDIIPSTRKKVEGKNLHVASPLDNVSFILESSAQKWKSIVQKRVECER